MTSDYPYEIPHEGRCALGRANKVVDVFKKQHQRGSFSAGQMVIRHRGEVLVSLALGTGESLDGKTRLTVTPQTLFPVYSAGKPMVALCIALLQQRGLIELDATVASYLPEFAQAGKEAITVDDVLTHKGGILIPELWQDVMRQQGEEELWQRICRTPAKYPRGTFAYMPGEYGWILSALIKKLTGKSTAEFFYQELAQPIGLEDMHYGLGERLPNEVVLSRWLGKPVEMIANANAAENFEEVQTTLNLSNTRNPAINMVSNAASLAAFYDFLLNKGKTRDGHQLIPSELLDFYTQRQVAGWNKSLNTYLAIGRGFMRGTLLPSSFGWWNSGSCFGHAGAFSILAFADSKKALSVAIVTNGNAGINDFFKRFIPLAQMIRGMV